MSVEYDITILNICPLKDKRSVSVREVSLSVFFDAEPIISVSLLLLSVGERPIDRLVCRTSFLFWKARHTIFFHEVKVFRRVILENFHFSAAPSEDMSLV